MDEAYKLAGPSVSLPAQFSALIRRATAHLQTGDLDAAETFLARSEELSIRAGMTNGNASVLLPMARLKAARRDYPAAMALLEKALELSGGDAGNRNAADALLGMCSVALQTKNTDRARTEGEKALALARKYNNKIGVAQAERCLGAVAMRSGDLAAAVQRLKTAAGGDSTAESDPAYLEAVAELRRKEGHRLEALAYLEKSAALSEMATRDVGDTRLRASIRSIYAGVGEKRAALLMELGESERAFDVMERSRALSLAEVVADSARGVYFLTAEQRKKETELVAAVTKIQRALFREGIASSERTALSRQLGEAEADLTVFQATVRRRGSSTAPSLVSWDSKRIRAELLGEADALVAYSIGREKSFVWALTREGLPCRGAMRSRS